MSVRKTEQYLPPGYLAKDLGHSSESADGKIALISFNGSSVVQGRMQSYVVFVLDNSLANQVDHFEWIMKSDVEESFSSESGFISFVPTSGENLTVTATLKGGTDENLGQIQLEQSIVQPNPELEDLFEQTDELAPLAGRPETSREVINDLWPFITELLSFDREMGGENEETSIHFFVFCFTIIGVLQVPFEIYNIKLEQIANALSNDDSSLFVGEGDAGIGVCRLIPYVLGMYIPESPGDTNYYLTKKEYPAMQSERLEFRQKLKKELEKLNIEKQINLFNLIRFPKSNIQMAITFLKGIQQDYFPGESIHLLINSEVLENSLFDRYLQKISERMNNFKSSPVKSMLSAVTPLYSLFANEQESQDWSGTNIPNKSKRKQLRREAKEAIDNDNPDMDEVLLKDIWNSTATEFEFNHVIIGAGYAAVINAATLPTYDSSMPSGLLPLIMIGEIEPWSEYKEKLMGQSPTNLSPSALKVLPLHLYEDYPNKPQNCPDDFSNCYLSSENFSLAIALTRNQLPVPVPALKGVVQAVNSQGDYYIVTVLLKKGTEERTIAIKTKKLDFCGGPGPPRKLPESQFNDAIRKDLRSPAIGFKRHLFGEEALRENTLLPPKDSQKKILIYGGSPTSAWVYERLFEAATIFNTNVQAEPYEVIWVAPLLWKGTGEDHLTPVEQNKIAFGAIDIGLRNKMVLGHSENRRFVAEITKVEKDGDKVKVTFDKNIGGSENEVVFDQIIESIGLDPSRTGGVNNILNGFQGSFGIIQDSHGDRPLGLELDEGTRKLRILGAAAVAAASVMLPGTKSQQVTAALALSDNMSSSNMLLPEDYADKMRAFLESLPEEVRVPPGITVAGITISRANKPLFALSRENNININTASLEELKARTVGDPDSTPPLFTDQEAEGIVECRINLAFSIPSFPGQPSGSSKHWVPGFISILKSDIESCEFLKFDDYNRIKNHIRV